MNGLVIIFVVFAVSLAMNVPIGFGLGLSGILYIMSTGHFSMTSFASVMVNAVDSFPLMAIPYFILAGALMEAGGISRQIVNFAMSLVGRVRGGMAMVAVISCAFFAALSGSGIATTAAIGAIMIPEMKKAGYKPAFSAALIAASGCLGPIIPPSVPMIMFGAATDTSISAMLIGGLLPGIMLAAMLSIYAYFYARKTGIEPSTESFSLSRCLHAFVSAIPALLVPIIILGGIYSGMFTPTEAAAVAVIYSFFAGTFIYKEIDRKKLRAALAGSAEQTGTIMVIAAAATFFARMLTMEQFHVIIKQFALGITDSRIVILLVLNIILLILGCLMDTTPAILVFAPILLPIATSYGVNAVHFGVMMCINLAIGLVTPPVGISLFVAAGQSKEPFAQLVKNVWPAMLVLIGGLFITAYFPAIVTFLPKLFGVMK